MTSAAGCAATSTYRCSTYTNLRLILLRSDSHCGHGMVLQIDLRYSYAFSSFQLRNRRYASDGMLLLLDWDDTIFPTTYLERRGISDPSQASERLRAIIGRVERRAIRLVNCGAVSNVAIVTIASLGWVRDCLEKWMPALDEVLSLKDVEIFSATQRYDSGDGFDRKFWAFQHFYDEEDDVVVVGDGPFEKWAASALKHYAPNVSFFGFVDAPSPEMLVQQLEFVHRALRPLAVTYEAADFEFAFGGDDSD